jgi:hypothetical protein
MGQVLVKAQPRKASAQQAREGRLARLNRFAAKVRAVKLQVKLQEVEGVEKDVPPLAFAAQPIENGQPIVG